MKYLSRFSGMFRKNYSITTGMMLGYAIVVIFHVALQEDPYQYVCSPHSQLCVHAFSPHYRNTRNRKPFNQHAQQPEFSFATQTCATTTGIQMPMLSTNRAPRCSSSIDTTSTILYEAAHPKRYPTEGDMFDIEKGPDHHLIENPPADTDTMPLDLKKGADRKIKESSKTKVNVHEMKVDAATLTLVSFGVLASVLFAVPLFHN
eukprot:307532_1